jgi:hypothetical protein
MYITTERGREIAHWIHTALDVIQRQNLVEKEMNYLHGDEPFFKSRELRIYSKIPQHFMDPEWFITVFTRALHR